ncbi:hypothetical protein HaLaN_03906, partial [Haematococcus lacustris]
MAPCTVTAGQAGKLPGRLLLKAPWSQSLLPSPQACLQDGWCSTSTRCWQQQTNQPVVLQWPPHQGREQPSPPSPLAPGLVALESLGHAAALVTFKAIITCRQLLRARGRDLAVVLETEERWLGPGRPVDSTVCN